MAKGFKTGGRQKGSVNHITAEIKVAAQEHGPAALKRIVELLNSPSEDIQLRAAQALLDRGYGKSAQAINHQGAAEGSNLVVEIVKHGSNVT